MKEVKLYTDGSCLSNPGPGGYCCILIYKNARKELIGGLENTTNNQMELQSVVEGLKALKESNLKVIIESDSKYVLDGLTKWMNGWKAKGWKLTSGGDVKNLDQWMQIDSLIIEKKLEVEVKWIKGHSGNLMNEYCDTKAREFATSLQKSLLENKR